MSRYVITSDEVRVSPGHVPPGHSPAERVYLKDQVVELSDADAELVGHENLRSLHNVRGQDGYGAATANSSP